MTTPLVARLAKSTVHGLLLSAAVVAVVLITCFWLGPLLRADLSPSDWGAIVATAFTGLAFAWLVLGYFQQGRSLELFYRAEIQPVLIFYRPGQGPWRLRNVGKGPAINIVIADGNEPDEWEENSRVGIAALAAGDEHHAEWAVHGGALVAIYDDALGRTYSALCYKHRTELTTGNRYPHLKPVKYEFDLGLLHRSNT